MATINANICIRRDTAANWTSNNPTLLVGEICYETDTGKFKVGTGTTWTATNYSGGVTAPGLGAIYRTVDSKLLDTLSVKDYGATGDGSTDDKLAIQAALNAGGTSSRAVYFPGTTASYKISGVLTVPDGVTVCGDGFDSLIETTNIVQNIFTMGHDTTVKDLHFKFPAASESGNPDNQAVIYVTGKNNVTVQNNRIQLALGNGGVYIRQSRNVTIKDNFIFGGLYTGGNTPGAGFADIVVLTTENTPPTASVEANRTVISGNYCLSNNGSGIIGNFYGNNNETLITGNICVTLDPATCTVGGTWKEIVSDGSSLGTLRRRHAIAFGYGNDIIQAPRSVISNNLCRNTLRTGVYLQAGSGQATPAPILVSGNYCSLNGQDASVGGTGTGGSSLEGGIWFDNVNPNSVITGNVIYDFKKPEQGAINYIFNSDGGTSGPTISNNYIFDSAGSGIQMVGQIRHTTLKNNHIVNSARHDVFLVCTASVTTLGGLLIEGNTIKRNNFNYASMLLDPQSGTLPSTVKGNRFLGHDKTSGGIPNTAGNEAITKKNTALHPTRPTLTRVIDNIVDNFHVGFALCNSAYISNASTRVFEVDYSRNTIRNCNFGFGISANGGNSCTPLCDNIFETGVTAVSPLIENGGGNGFNTGYIARKDGTRFIVLSLNATPAGNVGTWTIGDRVEYTTPTAGGFIGAVCTTAGSPGTWKTFGAISA